MEASPTLREFRKGEFGYYLDGKLIPLNSNDDYLKMIGLDRFMMYQILTPAEEFFFEKSIYTGDFVLKSDLPDKEKVFRTLFLEWIFNVPLQEQFRFLRAKKVVFKNIIFKNYYDLGSSEEKQESINYRNNSLELFNNKIEVDLEFEGCTFYGGIDFNNTTFSSLLFLDCTIDAPSGYRTFVGTQCHIKGNLSIERSELQVKTRIGKGYTSDFCDSLDFHHATIEKKLLMKNLRFFNPVLENGKERSDMCLDFYNSTISFIQIQNIECYDIPLDFSMASTKKAWIFESSFFSNSNLTSTIDFNSFHGEALVIRDCKIIGHLAMPYIQIEEFLEISTSTLIAYDYFNPNEINNKGATSLNMSNSNCPIVKLNDQFISLGTLNLSAISTHKLWLNNALLLGYEDSTNTTYTNSNSKPQHAINLEMAKITSYIGFNDLFLSKKSEKEFPTLEELQNKIEEQIESLKPFKNNSNKDETNDKDAVGAWRTWFKRAEVGVKELIKNLSVSEYKNSYSSSIIYGANFKGMEVSGQFDCRGAYFYSPITKKSELLNLRKKILARVVKGMQSFFRWFNRFFKIPPDIKYDVIPALDLRYLKLNGDLFLNESFSEPSDKEIGKDNLLYFKAVGIVDLQFANLNRFFLTPHLNTNPNHKWFINGLTYNGIFYRSQKIRWTDTLPWNRNRKSIRLEHINWFTPLLDVNHRRQPFEELAFFFNRIGNDSKAKRIIVKGRYRTTIILELIFYWLINKIARLGMPAYRSFIALIIIYLLGVYGFSYADEHGGFNNINTNLYLDEVSSNSRISFCSWEYSFLNMWPVKIVDSQQFVPTDKRFVFSLFSKNYETLSTGFYRLVHKVLSTTFLALFIIGITKITKQEHHPSNS